MSTVEQLGYFHLTSSQVVVIDPGYTLDTTEMRHGGCFVTDCRLGEWKVHVAMDTPSVEWWPAWRQLPCSLITTHSLLERELTLSADWRRVSDEIGQDGGLIGLFDAAHFEDVSMFSQAGVPGVASDRRKLWYDLVCQAIGHRSVAILPHGAVVSWDGSMDVDTISIAGGVVGIRLSISGWPNPYEKEA